MAYAIRVTCPNGRCAYFGSMGEALHWAEGGHLCVGVVHHDFTRIPTMDLPTTTPPPRKGIA